MSEIKTDRLRIDGCDNFSVSAAFITIEGHGYKRKKYTPTSDVSHLEVYQYLSPSDEKITLVYDTKARILTVDASPSVLNALRPLLPVSVPKAENKPAIKQDNRLAVKAENILTVKHDNRPAIKADNKPTVKQDNRPAVKADNKPVSVKKKTEKANKTQKESPKKPTAEKKTDVGSVTVKNVGAKRLDWAIKDMKTLDGVRVKAVSDADGRKEWKFTDAQKHTATLRQEGGSVVITGKAGTLMTELHDRIAGKCDMRLLRKYLPVALRYLSEPSKIDLSNGMTDFNSVSRLSDYSVLLMAPYRALEKLIYDLQQAENINVKMIGQAYEKDEDGHYRLKKGYLKRIGSVIYPEVMSALYTEYFAIRNFYTHSDNSAESQSRGISDKAEAQKILRNLLDVIEYNCKKLSEIGFTVAEE